MTSEQQLFQIAETQLGYFTTKQAVAAGYSIKNHAYHVQQKHWIREHRGIYRLVNFPQTSESEMVLWSLWSRNRNEIPEGVYSYETALSLYEVSDAMPAKMHMTVPTKFRKSIETPKILVLHRANLSREDVLKKNGYSVTTPIRTLKDLVCDKSTDQNILDQAVQEFRSRGLVTERQMLRLVEDHPFLAKYLLQARTFERRA